MGIFSLTLQWRTDLISKFLNSRNLVVGAGGHYIIDSIAFNLRSLKIREMVGSRCLSGTVTAGNRPGEYYISFEHVVTYTT